MRSKISNETLLEFRRYNFISYNVLWFVVFVFARMGFLGSYLESLERLVMFKLIKNNLPTTNMSDNYSHGHDHDTLNDTILSRYP